MNQQKFSDWGKLIFFYLLIFLMLREWLVPVIELTGTGYYELLVLFIVICLLTNIFNLNPILSFVIKIVYIAWFMVYTHSPNAGNFYTNVVDGFVAIFTGNWFDITETVKSMLFLILLWMTVYLIHHWLTVRRSILFFFILTVLFLALIDTFTTYDADMGIVRTMVLGLLLTGILFIEKLISENGMKSSTSNYFKLLLPLVILIGISSIFAYTMPKEKASENLPGPLNEVVRWANSSLQTTGKIGYVEEDGDLGGDFETDDAPVLQYTTKEPQYLRVESKSLYTGKGWERSSEDVFVSTFNYTDPIKTSLPSGNKEDEVSMKVKMDKKYNFLVQPYGIKQVLESNEKNNGFYIETESGKIRPTVLKEQISLLNYELTYSSPVYGEKELDDSRVEMIAEDQALSKKDREIYLQLPSNLPDRVKELALNITEDEESVYDKANAIVNYFQTSGYEYSRENVGFPTNGEDYVDRFLFDTKVGYCDNFSTSMSVMLRTLDIPTRWVKGFSPGEVNTATTANENLEEDEKNYIVTNNNAHSWVEVYIPNVGWMPFEPTIGFEGFDQIQEEQTDASAAPENNNEEEKTEEQQTQEEQDVAEEEKKAEEEKQKATEQQQQENEANTTNTASTIWIWIGILAAALVIGTILFKQRRKWMPKVIVSYNKQRKPKLANAYDILIKQLNKQYGLNRQAGETLSDFAKRVDKELQTNDMTKLTTMMEQELYDPNTTPIKWEQFNEYWENLINKSRG